MLFIYKLTKRLLLAVLIGAAFFAFSLLVTIPLTYTMNYFMPQGVLGNASHFEMVSFAARLSAVLMIPPLILYCHSMLPDHAKLETDVVLSTIHDLLNDGVFLLLIFCVVVSLYFNF